MKPEHLWPTQLPTGKSFWLQFNPARMIETIALIAIAIGVWVR